MVKVQISQFACQKVLKQCCHKSVLGLNSDKRKGTLPHLSAQKKKLTKVLYFLKGSMGKKRLQLKNVSYLIMSSLSLTLDSTHI